MISGCPEAIIRVVSIGNFTVFLGIQGHVLESAYLGISYMEHGECTYRLARVYEPTTLMNTSISVCSTSNGIAYYDTFHFHRAYNKTRAIVETNI